MTTACLQPVSNPRCLPHPDVKSLDIEIETRKGEVQFSGFVDNQTQIDRAIAVTREVPGVKRIENKVSLGARR